MRSRWIRSTLSLPLLGLLLVSALLPGRAVARSHWDPIERVENVAPVLVEVKGNSRVYFPVGAATPLQFTISGPARLRIISRAEVASLESPAISYSIRVEADGRAIGQATTSSSASAGAIRRDRRGALCKSRSLIVEIPDGSHRLTVRVGGATSALVRLLAASPLPAGGTRMISLTPVHAAGSVTVLEGERMISYFTTRVGSPVRYRVIGPTRLELNSRLDFEPEMRGRQGYRIAIRVSGSPAREASFTTTKAMGAVYQEKKDLVPSKIDRTAVTVPAGPHEIAVELIAPKGRTAQIHVRLPEPAVGNEE